MNEQIKSIENSDTFATPVHTPTGVFPGSTPRDAVAWPPNQHRSNQIQQTKGSAKAQVTQANASVQPSTPTVQARTTPQKVSNVRVVRRTNGNQRNVTVQFSHPSGDPYFAGANVYLKRAGQQPTLVASGAQSPLTFTAAATNAPHSIYVTSVGSWGETSPLSSPSAAVRLS